MKAAGKIGSRFVNVINFDSTENCKLQSKAQFDINKDGVLDHITQQVGCSRSTPNSEHDHPWSGLAVSTPSGQHVILNHNAVVRNGISHFPRSLDVSAGLRFKDQVVFRKGVGEIPYHIKDKVKLNGMDGFTIERFIVKAATMGPPTVFVELSSQDGTSVVKTFGEILK